MTPAQISVVIPTINEEVVIGAAIESARNAGAGEIIISDGGSQDQTVRIASEFRGTKIVRSLPGRGVQLNSGALLVDPGQEVILFLHADNVLDKQCLQQICELPEVGWGAFRQRIDSSATIYRFIERGNEMRVRFRGVPFGDQAIFVRRCDFAQSGGFDEVPLMEDVGFAKKMRKTSRPVLLDGPVTISSRRWDRRGPIRQTLLNWKIQIAYAFGMPPQRLKDWYRS